MYQISNEKFGLFVTELRKEKNLTQKDLAEKLYVSDKTVSKWERGLSMPNVVLLIPIADILDVTVTELLRGEKIDTQKNIDTKEVEELVVGSLDMAVRNSIHQHRKNWILAYLLCFFISITEIIMLVVSGSSLAEMKGDILLVTGGMLLFGAWFCFFAKDILPTYYDANKINYVSQGIFRIHLVGLSFNNGNWIYICTTLKIWTLATVLMDKVNGKLTVFFEEPFWVGIFERIEDGKLSVAKVTFGAEPKDYEVQEYIQKCYFSLKFSPVVETVVKDIKRNPKRMQREAKKQMLEIGIGTKSQQALKLQQEQNKQERKEKSRKRKEAEEQRMFELKQRKKREKHKGH